jgi:hypothetical protein
MISLYRDHGDESHEEQLTNLQTKSSTCALRPGQAIILKSKSITLIMSREHENIAAEMALKVKTQLAYEIRVSKLRRVFVESSTHVRLRAAGHLAGFSIKLGINKIVDLCFGRA